MGGWHRGRGMLTKGRMPGALQNVHTRALPGSWNIKVANRGVQNAPPFGSWRPAAPLRAT